MDIAGNSSTNISVETGTTYSGTFDYNGDKDWYAIYLEPGVYSIDIDARVVSYERGLISLVHADGSFVDGTSSNSLQRLEVRTAGTYYLELWTGNSDEISFAGDTYKFKITNWQPFTPETPELIWSIRTNYLVRDQHDIKIFFNNDGDSTGWTKGEIASVQAALDAISAHVDLDFRIVTNASEADWKLSTFEENRGYAGRASYPQIFDTQFIEFWRGDYGWSKQGFEPGTRAFSTLIHEFGHALGLSHPHNPVGGSQGLLDLDDPYGNGAFDLNDDRLSIMSYRHTAMYYATSFMPIDLGALHDMYGARDNNHENTIYTMMPGSGFKAIWDTGGIDELRVKPGNGGLWTIDLRAATLDYEHGGGGFISMPYQSDYGVVIAHDVVIENATGGSSKDIIIGNEVDNRLRGKAGNDHMDGGDGADILNGGQGNDKLTGGEGADRFVFNGKFGRDVIKDFDASEGDIINLAKVNGITDYKDLMRHHVETTAKGLLITADNGSSILLKSIDETELGKDSFFFF